MYKNRYFNIAKTKTSMENQLHKLKHNLLQLRYSGNTQRKAALTTELSNAIKLARQITNKQQVLQENIDIITDIRDELNNIIRLNWMTTSEKAEITHYRDVLFSPSCFGDAQTVLQHVYECNVTSRQITQIFNKFVKGISYFSHEQLSSNREPVYHRLGSCPPKGNLNYNCVSARNPLHVEALEKCYIERLVYDSIWSELTNCQQDKSHLEWLINTRDAWQTCFPGKDMKITVDFNEKRFVNNTNVLFKDRIPIRLEVQVRGQGYERIDTYIRTWMTGINEYTDIVTCERLFNGVIHSKVSTYDDEGLWVPPYTGGKHKRNKKSLATQ